MDKTKQQTFKQAMLDAALEEFKDIPGEQDIDLEFSEHFEAWGHSMLCPSGDPPVRRFRKGLRRALFIAAILAALTTTVLAVPAIREGLIKFFQQNAGTHYEFSFDPEQAATAPKTIEKAYMPTYIPNGYTAEVIDINSDLVVGIWVSGAGEYISFDQLPIPNDSEGPQPDAEDVTVETIVLNGYEVFCVYADGYTYHWTDNEYFYQLYFNASIAKEDSLKVFSSITLTESITPE